MGQNTTLCHYSQCTIREGIPMPENEFLGNYQKWASATFFYV